MALDPKKVFATAFAAIAVILLMLAAYLVQPAPIPPPGDSSIVIDTLPPDTVPTPPAYDISEGGVATIAERPRIVVDTTYPTSTRTLRVAATGNLQAALDSAAGGDVILLPPGATYTGNFVLRNKSTGGWIVLRTDLTDAQLGVPGTMMTPSKAAALRLAKI